MSHEEIHKKTIRDHIIEAAKGGEIEMTPKWHFVLKAILGIVGSCIILFTILYLASFIIFILRRTGVWFVPVFGSRGWVELILALPWVLILFSIVFIVVLETLVRKYSFAYRRPVLYSVLGIFAVAIVGGFAVASTPLHRQIFRYADEHHVPFARPFYHQFGDQISKNIHPGHIINVSSDGFILEDRDGFHFKVFITSETRLPLGDSFETDDFVVVFGDYASDTIRAFGIRKIENIGE